jgi:hypothetical protein
VVFGCWSWLLPAEAEKHGWNDFEPVYTPKRDRKRQYNTDKPALYYVPVSGERAAFYLLQVSPGRDFVRLYAQSLKLLLTTSAHEITGDDETKKEELAKDKALTALLERVRGKDFNVGVFRIKAQSKASFYKSELGLDKMANAIKGAHVLIGGVKDVGTILHQKLKGWYVGDDAADDNASEEDEQQLLSAGPRIAGTNGSPELWGFEVRRHRDGRKLMLLGSAITYWGELAGSLATALFELGAESVLHVAVKVGGHAHKGTSKEYRVLAPTSFAIVDQRHRIGKIAIENVFAGAAGVRDASAHASVPTAFDETALYLDSVMLELSPTTVDDEGAHIAKAAAKAKKAFGALYFVSDYVVRLHEIHEGGAAELASAADKARQLELQQNVGRVVADWLDERYRYVNIVWFTCCLLNIILGLLHRCRSPPIFAGPKTGMA